MAKDARYTYLTEFITIHAGLKLSEMIDFLNYCNSFCQKEESGTSDKYKGNYISVNKVMGMKFMMIYGYGSDSDGYATFNSDTFHKLIKRIETYANENKISLK
jgi:hypothetical protein